MRLSLGYPSRAAEKLLLQQNSRHDLIEKLQVIFQHQEILQLQCMVNQITLSDVVFEYMLDLAEETRKGRHGLSPRGLLALKNQHKPML